MTVAATADLFFTGDGVRNDVLFSESFEAEIKGQSELIEADKVRFSVEITMTSRQDENCYYVSMNVDDLSLETSRVNVKGKKYCSCLLSYSSD